MYSVSDLFNQYISQPDRQFDIKAVIGTTTYINTSVVEFDITESISSSEELTLGAVIAATLTLSLCTTDIIPPNSKITPSIRLGGVNGYTEWLPLGDYYVDDRKTTNGVVTFSCIDRLIFGQQPYYTLLNFPATMGDVLNDICSNIGVILDSSVVINASYLMPAVTEGATIRDMLGYIASAHGSNVKLGRDGKLKFICLGSSVSVPITPTIYMKAEKTNPLKSYTKIIALTSSQGDGIYSGDVQAPAESTMTISNPYITQAILDAIFTQLQTFAYMPYAIDWKGMPQMEVGDGVQVTLRDGTSFASYLFTNKLTFKGGLKMTSSARAISQLKSEFVFAGSIAAKLVTLDNKITTLPNKIKSDYDQAIDDATAMITGSKGGNVVMRADITGKPCEILIMDTLDILTAQKVWRWNIGGFGYSSTGVNGTYETAITMDGRIVASFMTAIQIHGEDIIAGNISADRMTYSGGPVMRFNVNSTWQNTAIPQMYQDNCGIYIDSTLSIAYGTVVIPDIVGEFIWEEGTYIPAIIATSAYYETTASLYQVYIEDEFGTLSWQNPNLIGLKGYVRQVKLCLTPRDGVNFNNTTGATIRVSMIITGLIKSTPAEGRQQDLDNISDALTSIGYTTPHDLSSEQLATSIQAITSFGVSFKFTETFTRVSITIPPTITVALGTITEYVNAILPTNNVGTPSDTFTSVSITIPTITVTLNTISENITSLEV